MDPLSAAVSIASAVSATTLLTSSVISTQYNMLREIRALDQSLEELRRIINESELLLRTYSERMGCLRDISEHCEQIASLTSASSAKRGKGLRTNRALERILLEGCEGGTKGLRVLGEIRTESFQGCWQGLLGTEPTFWKLQRWVMDTGKRFLLFLRIGLPEAVKQPSPEVLLVSWLVIVVAVVAYYEMHPGHSYRKLFILGSALVAIFIGIVEGSGMNSIILTDIPWSLTLGMMLDCLVHNFIRVLSSDTAERGISASKEQCHETEKVDLA